MNSNMDNDTTEPETELDDFVGSEDGNLPVSQKIGVGRFIALGLLALLAGGVSGGAIAYWQHSQMTAQLDALPEIDTAQIETLKTDSHSRRLRIENLDAQIANMERSIETLKTRMDRLESDTAQKLITEPLNNKEPVSNKEEHLSPPTDQDVVKPITSEEAEHVDVDQEVGEHSISDSVKADQEISEYDDADIKEIYARLMAVESSIEILENNPSVITIPPFPKEALLEALSKGGSKASQGWWGKVLNSQVSVTSPALLNEIEKIETLSAQGDYETALSLIDTLPEEARFAVQDWVSVVKIQTRNEKAQQ